MLPQFINQNPHISELIVQEVINVALEKPENMQQVLSLNLSDIQNFIAPRDVGDPCLNCAVSQCTLLNKRRFHKYDFDLLDLGPGTEVIVQDDYCDNLYVLKEGSCGVYVNEQLKNVLGPGDVFGELAFQWGARRAASVVTFGPTKLFCLRGHKLGFSVRKNSNFKHQLVTEEFDLQLTSQQIVVKYLKQNTKDEYVSRIQLWGCMINESPTMVQELELELSQVPLVTINQNLTQFEKLIVKITRGGKVFQIDAVL